ncbi:GNAT acetyltransferase [compost metagenome]
MTLLFGESGNTRFNKSFRDYALNKDNNRDIYEWMQAFPDTWHIELKKLFEGHLIKSDEMNGCFDKGIVELNTRVNFKFDKSLYLNRKKTSLYSGVKIIRTDRQILRAMKGSVVPEYFWESEDDFLEKGIGFSLLHQGELASTAFSALIHHDKLELGIETVAEFRGMGFAEQSCSALIDYCIKNQLEPVWACRLENVGSYKLAQKLGFVPSAMIPYYRLGR